jgi:hypothetical protein
VTRKICCIFVCFPLPSPSSRRSLSTLKLEQPQRKQKKESLPFRMSNTKNPATIFFARSTTSDETQIHVYHLILLLYLTHDNIERHRIVFFSVSERERSRSRSFFPETCSLSVVGCWGVREGKQFAFFDLLSLVEILPLKVSQEIE